MAHFRLGVSSDDFQILRPLHPLCMLFFGSLANDHVYKHSVVHSQGIAKGSGSCFGVGEERPGKEREGMGLVCKYWLG